MTLNEKIIDSVQNTTGLRCFEGEPTGDIYGRFAYFVTLQSSNRFGEVAIFFVERPVYNRLNPTRATEDCTQLAIRWLNGLYAYSGLKFQEVISQNSVRDDKGGYGVGMRVVLANETAISGGKVDFVELVLTSDPLGAAQLSGAKKYIKGKTATAGATANHGFTFAKWTDGTSDVSTDNPYSFIINDDTSLVASMTRNNYTLTLSGDTGVDSTTGSGTYPYEQSVTATATAKHGYAFTNWTSGGTVISTDNPYTFSLLDNTSLVANTGRANYTVTLSEDIQGSITTFTGAGSYPYEQSVTVGATAAYGFTFAKWTDGTSDVSTDNPYTFQLLDNTSLVAAVTRNNYILSLSGGTGVTSTTGGGSYPYEQTVTATAVLDSHYDFSNWTSGGTVVSSSNPYEFSLLADTTLQANATPKSYNVLGVSNDSTMGSVSGGGTYTYGDTVTLTATPIGDYVFDNWTVDGIQVSTDNPYVFTASEAVIVQGNFKVNEVIVTVTVNDPTMGSASGGGSYTPGTVVTVTATANTGYEFVNWTKNGIVVSSSASYAFAALEDTTVTAVFKVALTPYLTFTAKAPNSTVQFCSGKYAPSNTGITLEYSTDGQTWTPCTQANVKNHEGTSSTMLGFNQIVLANVGDFVQFRGDNNRFGSTGSNGTDWQYRNVFMCYGDIKITGKLEGLIRKTMTGAVIPTSNMNMAGLFWSDGPTSEFRQDITEVDIVLPRIQSPTNSACYNAWFAGNMFYRNTSLVSAEVDVNNMNETHCGLANMFQDCTSLVNPPTRLPAAQSGVQTAATKFQMYQGMFQGCTSLERTPLLNPITMLATSASTKYLQAAANMFSGCTSLKDIYLDPESTGNWMYSASYSGIPVYSCNGWMTNVSSTGKIHMTNGYTGFDTFLNNRGVNGAPANWTVEYYS